MICSRGGGRLVGGRGASQQGQQLGQLVSSQQGGGGRLALCRLADDLGGGVLVRVSALSLSLMVISSAGVS